MGHHHHFHSHGHHSHPVRGEYTYREEPVTLRQKRSWKIRGIIWMIPAVIIVVASLVLAIVFSVIDSKLPGAPFFVMPAFAGVPLAFAIPHLKQGFARKPLVTQVREYESGYVRRDVAPLKAKVECPKCGAENDFGNATCNECGEELPQRCPLCGAELITDDEACRDCGLALK